MVLLLSLPLITIAIRSFAPASDVWRHLASTVLAGYVTTSAGVVLAVCVLALVLGVTTAWLVAACDFPGRRVFEWALVLPLAVPAYIAGYTYAGMLDVAGPVQRVLRALMPDGADRFIYIDVLRTETVILVLAMVLYPYVYLTARVSFLRQSRAVLDASLTLGRSAWGTFFRVALPMARPAIAAGVALVAMEVLNDYGTVKYYGVTTMTTAIFRAWFGMGDLDAAIRLAGLLMLFVFILLAIERAQRGRARFDDGTAAHRPLRRHSLGGAGAVAAFTVCLVPVLLGFLLPVAQLGYWAVRTARTAVDVAFGRIVLHSFGLALAAAVLCIAAGLLVAWAVRLARSEALRELSRVSVLGYAIPGAVIAVGVMIPFAWVDHGVDAFMRETFGVSTRLLLSGSLAALTFAYVVRFMAVAHLPVESGLARVCGNMDDAARSLGASPSRTLARVALPLLRGTLLGALILVFIDVLKELPLTLILRPFNFDTLSTRAFQLATDEQIAQSANAALVIIGASVLPVVVLNRLLVRRNAT
ncbi:MAG: ABC transporter permease [Longimicrobiales bacterium]